MRIAIGSDHAALDAKSDVVKHLASRGIEVNDLGTHDTNSCDYPDYAALVSTSVQQKESDRGILICGTGIGMSIAANRFKGIRAALCYTEELAMLSRQHNDANILCLGARTQSVSYMIPIIDKWLDTAWEGDRHARRIEKIETNSRGQDAK